MKQVRELKGTQVFIFLQHPHLFTDILSVKT